MIPMYFGSSARKLFGIYEAPMTGSAARGVVICPPWGQEYLRAHRALRLLATRLCNAGFHVFRFDYSGTGDSVGDGVPQDQAIEVCAVGGDHGGQYGSVSCPDE